MKELVFVKKEQAFTTSLVVAEGTSNEHRSIIRLIQNHTEHFERWGKIKFMDSKSTNPLGGRPTQVALLNEQQATFLITLLRNNDIVLDFKAELVDQFYKMRDFIRERKTPEWQDIRLSTKTGHSKLMDVVEQKLVPLALEQGIDPQKAKRFFSNYNRMINICLGIKSGDRDNLSAKMLYELDKMLGMTADKASFLADEKLDYHKIYSETKEFILDYSSHWLMIR